ncbi:MAG: DUF167 domain-containing protein [Proteobacteria bacterium]|nr:DUF167 domain-containing protein [Pseudomonadota bacterium]
MSRDWCGVTPQGIRLAVHIVPNASKSEIIGVLEDALKIRLQAQAIEGKANEALIRFVADVLNVPKNAVRLTHGHAARRKLLEVACDLSVDTVRSRLQSFAQNR